MPRGSVADAKRWHEVNVASNTHDRRNAPSKRVAPELKKAPTKKKPAKKPARTPNLGEMAESLSEGLESSIKFLTGKEKELQRRVEESEGEADLERFFLNQHLTVSEQLRKSLKDFHGIQKDQDESVSVEEVGQVLGVLFREFRRRLDNMARRCASMVPPEVAPIVEKAVDKEVRTMMGGLNECDYIS